MATKKGEEGKANEGDALPVPRIDKALRDGLRSKRVSKGTPVYVTGAVERIVRAVIEEADKEANRSAKTRKRVGYQHLVGGVRKHDGLGRLFRGYVFYHPDKMQYDALSLLTKSDARRLVQKREAAKRASKIPSVVDP